eukprot:jgi/Botrbrau1/11449/Bobra.0328s0009.1
MDVTWHGMGPGTVRAVLYVGDVDVNVMNIWHGEWKGSLTDHDDTRRKSCFTPPYQRSTCCYSKHAVVLHLACYTDGSSLPLLAG